jgi:dihydrolipoamide dehydrogenase
VAAIRAAQLGADVTLIEKGRLGGTCLNVGCIPTKVLLHAAELYTAIKHEGPSIGIFADNLRFDWPSIVKRKDEVVSYLTECVGGLLQSNGVKRVQGTGRLTAPNRVEALTARGVEAFEADAVILATGSEPAIPPIPGLDLEGVVASEGALSFETLPRRVAIAGGGVIGVEFASVFSAFGSEVTVVEMLPQILPNVDAEVAGILRRSLESKGVTFYTNARLNAVTSSADGVGLTLSVALETRAIGLTVDKLLVATGRRPYTENLGLESLGVAMERGRVTVNHRMETSIENLYAIGDCASRILLAHVAAREGEIAAENIMGHDAVMDYRTVPSAIYTSPAVASVGLSEDDARKAGCHQIQIGRFPLMANGKSVITGDNGGMIKIVSDGRYGEILGIHIVGGPATDMIGEGGLALRLEATLDEIVSTIHAHPTVGEAIGEAALASWGKAIHLPKPKGA